jgi:hypothetical protein
MSRRPAQAGFILFIVMIVIAMIALAGMSFVLTLATENKAVHLQGDQMQLGASLASGVELLKSVCDLPPEQRQQYGGIYDNADLLRGLVVSGDRGGDAATRVSVVSPQIQGDAITGIRFGVQNESARLNLAVLSAWEQDWPGAAKQALLNLPGMTETIADSILDWIDPDDARRPVGAEADYYARRGLPYEPRNGVPATLEELLLVRDVSRLHLFGADIDWNYAVRPGELQYATGGLMPGGTTGRLPWAMLVTLYSAERNTSAAGDEKIYLNDPDLAHLHQQLSDTFDSQLADFVVAYRQFGPWDETSGERPEPGGDGDGSGRRDMPPPGREVAEVPPLSGGRPAEAGTPTDKPNRGRYTKRTGRNLDPEMELDLSLPAEYEIQSVLDVVGVAVQLPSEEGETTDGEQSESDEQLPSNEGETTDGEQTESDDEPDVIHSPMENDPASLSDLLPRWIDMTTTTDEPVIRGRVNVDEAPRCVLLGVPGLEPAVVDRILARRGTGAARGDPVRRHALWLFSEGLVDLQQMKQLLKYVTGGGDVFRAQLVARHQRCGLAARGEVVVDATVAPPRQVYWKDLSLLGAGYAPDLLGDAPGSAR